MPNKFPRGSEWRKWDLHVHTKATNKNDQFFSVDFDSFCKTFFKKALENKIQAVGITDYFSIENYKKVIEYRNAIASNNEFTNEEKEKICNIFILPNVELRMLPVTDSGNLINIHCLFNPDFIPNIDNDFFNSLTYTSHSKSFLMNYADMVALGKQIDNTISDNATAYKKGVGNFVVAHDKLKELLLKNENLRKNVIVAVSNSSRDGNSGLQKHFDLFESEAESSLDDVRRTIYHLSDCIFSSNDNDVKYFLGKKTDTPQEVIRKCGSLKPCIHGSDAHTEDKLFKPDQNKYCWLKADLTFEGLKSIIYEPNERVVIGNDSPEFAYDKPYFESVFINQDIFPYTDDNTLKIKKATLPLNKNLVTIIGGRGEGKSTLINYLGNAFNRLSDTEITIPTSDQNFSIRYNKINSLDISDEDKKTFYAKDKENNQLDFVFISQRELHTKIASKHTLSDKLKEILHIEKTTFSSALTQGIDDTIQKVYALEKWKKVTDENGNMINSKEFNTASIAKNQALLDNLKNSKNKEQIDKYNANIKKISDASKIIQTAENIILKVDDFISALNEDITAANKDIFKLPDLGSYKTQITRIKEEYLEKLKTFDKNNEEIKENLIKQGISGDLSTLLENTKKYQSLITSSQAKLIEIEEKEKALEEAMGKRGALGLKIKENYQEQKSEIDTGWENFLSKHSDEKKNIIKTTILKEDSILISGEIIFNVDEFYSNLERVLDKRTFSGIVDLKREFGIVDMDSWATYIKDKFNDKLGSLNGSRKTDFSNLFFNINERAKYLRTEAQITCGGKKLEKLSAGQQGTAYLRIQLANSAFSVPIIFDQPEDDLDNKFIMSELVEVFRELKKYRQIIIITHNANLVVNADAEQVIVAKKEDDSFIYPSGSLENFATRESVCEILEGGENAFKKREQRYNIAK